MLKRFFLIPAFAIFGACQSLSSHKPEILTASELTRAYDQSPSGFRSRYDGREIVVSGYVIADASMPDPSEFEGLIFIEDTVDEQGSQIFCWFTQKEAAAFSNLEPGQLITVKGVFNGENGTELRFCKLVRIERSL